VIEEYCSDCDKKTRRKVDECPECTPIVQHDLSGSEQSSSPKLPSLDEIKSSLNYDTSEKYPSVDLVYNTIKKLGNF
jgi:hypothetical protein